MFQESVVQAHDTADQNGLQCRFIIEVCSADQSYLFSHAVFQGSAEQAHDFVLHTGLQCRFHMKVCSASQDEERGRVLPEGVHVSFRIEQWHLLCLSLWSVCPLEGQQGKFCCEFS